MPHLVLQDDRGKEIFKGEVSWENVNAVARLLRAHMPTLRLVAQLKEAFGSTVGTLQQLAGLGAPTPTPRRPRRRRPPPR